MKSGWEYIEENGIREKMAPNTLISNVLESENGPGLLDFIRNYTHPIGSIWMTLGDQDPNQLFGGTWLRIEDTFLLAAGNEYTAGETGGEATHALTTVELPAHAHSTGSDEANPWYYGLIKSISGRSGKLPFQSGTGQYALGSNSGYEDVGFQANTGMAGEGLPHNNMPPFLAVNVWRRTA